MFWLLSPRFDLGLRVRGTVFDDGRGLVQLSSRRASRDDVAALSRFLESRLGACFGGGISLGDLLSDDSLEPFYGVFQRPNLAE